MKDINSTLQAFLATRAPFRIQNFLWIDPVTGSSYGYWDGPEDLTISVEDPSTGSTVSRSYYGGGRIIEVPTLVAAASLEVKTMDWVLSGSSEVVQSMLEAVDLKNAAIQWHQGYVNPTTELFINTPFTVYQGFVNGVSGDQSAHEVDGESYPETHVTLTIASHTRQLTRSSSKTRSYAHGKERSGDKIFKYTGSAHHWKIPWGTGKKSHKDQSDNPGGKGDIPQYPRDWR